MNGADIRKYGFLGRILVFKGNFPMEWLHVEYFLLTVVDMLDFYIHLKQNNSLDGILPLLFSACRFCKMFFM
jgi:hypothetical protein